MHSEIYITSNKSFFTPLSLCSQFCLLNIKDEIAESSLFLAILPLNHNSNKTRLLLSIAHPEALFHALIKCLGSCWCGHTNAGVDFGVPSAHLAALRLQLRVLALKWPTTLHNIGFTGAIQSPGAVSCHTPRLRQLPVTSGLSSRLRILPRLPARCLQAPEQNKEEALV